MMQTIFQTWALARKDLRLFLGDRRGVLLCFAVPILLATAFGMVFDRPGGTAGFRPRVLVVAGDSAPLTRKIIAALCACDKLEATESNSTAARKALEDRSAAVVIELPPDFQRITSLARPDDWTPPQVRLLHHPGGSLEARWTEGVFTEVAMREAATEALAPLQDLGLAPPATRPFDLSTSAVAGPGACSFQTYSHSFCGMTLQYLLFWGMDSGLLLLRERRQGLWRRLRAAPVALTTLLAGRALATMLVALAQIVVVFLFGRLVFGVTVTGSLVGFGALAVAAALLSAATGLVVAALGGNEGRARSVAILTILSLSMLGGLWLPSFLLPNWAQRLALALPTTWAARGFEGVTWQGMGLSEALRCAGVLTVFSAVFLAAAWLAFAHAEVRRLEGEKS